jgi:transcriptional regulator GlxA family with amidase domain
VSDEAALLATTDRLRRIVELIGEEAEADHPCRDIILARLVEVLFVEACRFRVGCAAPEERGMIAGLSDPALAGTLRALHADISRGWTVEHLARVAGMSRAVFAERFTRRVGTPPMRYLLEWRVAVAKDMLRDGDPSLAAVATSVGYHSASSFTAAFTRVAGSSPSEFARASAQTLHL